MSKLDAIIEAYEDQEFLIADGFDEAVIGLDDTSMRLIYSTDKCMHVLISKGMSPLEAEEFFDFNVKGSYVGNKTPIFCEDYF